MNQSSGESILEQCKHPRSASTINKMRLPSSNLNSISPTRNLVFSIDESIPLSKVSSEIDQIDDFDVKSIKSELVEKSMEFCLSRDFGNPAFYNASIGRDVGQFLFYQNNIRSDLKTSKFKYQEIIKPIHGSFTNISKRELLKRSITEDDHLRVLKQNPLYFITKKSSIQRNPDVFDFYTSYQNEAKSLREPDEPLMGTLPSSSSPVLEASSPIFSSQSDPFTGESDSEDENMENFQLDADLDEEQEDKEFTYTFKTGNGHAEVVQDFHLKDYMDAPLIFVEWFMEEQQKSIPENEDKDDEKKRLSMMSSVLNYLHMELNGRTNIKNLDREIGNICNNSFCGPIETPFTNSSGTGRGYERFSNKCLNKLLDLGLVKRISTCGECAYPFTGPDQFLQRCPHCKFKKDSDHDFYIISPRLYFSYLLLSEPTTVQLRRYHENAMKDRQNQIYSSYYTGEICDLSKKTEIKNRHTLYGVLRNGSKHFEDIESEYAISLGCDGAQINQSSSSTPFAIRIENLFGSKFSEIFQITSLRKTKHDFSLYLRDFYDDIALSSTFGFHTKQYDGNKIKIKIHLAGVFGDNPATLSFVNFGSATSLSPCRYCSITAETEKEDEMLLNLAKSDFAIENLKKRLEKRAKLLSKRGKRCSRTIRRSFPLFAWQRKDISYVERQMKMINTSRKHTKKFQKKDFQNFINTSGLKNLHKQKYELSGVYNLGLFNLGLPYSIFMDELHMLYENLVPRLLEILLFDLFCFDETSTCLKFKKDIATTDLEKKKFPLEFVLKLKDVLHLFGFRVNNILHLTAEQTKLLLHLVFILANDKNANLDAVGKTLINNLFVICKLYNLKRFSYPYLIFLNELIFWYCYTIQEEGYDARVYNHELLHLVQNITNHGNMSSNSCYGLEQLVGKIKHTFSARQKISLSLTKRPIQKLLVDFAGRTAPNGLNLEVHSHQLPNQVTEGSYKLRDLKKEFFEAYLQLAKFICHSHQLESYWQNELKLNTKATFDLKRENIENNVPTYARKVTIHTTKDIDQKLLKLDGLDKRIFSTISKAFVLFKDDNLGSHHGHAASLAYGFVRKIIKVSFKNSIYNVVVVSKIMNEIQKNESINIGLLPLNDAVNKLKQKLGSNISAKIGSYGQLLERYEIEQELKSSELGDINYINGNFVFINSKRIELKTVLILKENVIESMNILPFGDSAYIFQDYGSIYNLLGQNIVEKLGLIDV